MPSRFNLPPELDIDVNEDFTKDRLDRAWNYLVQRLLILDSFQPSYQEQVDLLRSTGLTRLNEALQPVYERIVAIADLGAIFQATSDTTNKVELGVKTFILSEDDRQRFAPAAYMIAATGDGLDTQMKGAVSSYDRTTGTLTLNIDTVIGTGEFSQWTLAPTSADTIARAYTDVSIAALKSDLIGTATAAGDSLGELQATATQNRQRAADDAVAMAIALG